MSSNVYHNPASSKPLSASMKRKVIKQKAERISKLPKISSFLKVNQKQINNLNNHDGDGDAQHSATANEMDQEPVEVLIPEPMEVLIAEENLKTCRSEIECASNLKTFHKLLSSNHPTDRSNFDINLRDAQTKQFIVHTARIL